jgi:hypothetical protein
MASGFVLDSAACVAAGRFNPAILVPEWIVKQGILPDTDVELMSAMGSAMTTFNMCGLQWRANLTRLEVLAEREGADPGEFVARLLEQLEHTPLRAVGSNFRYSVMSPADAGALYSLASSSILKKLEANARATLNGTAIAEYAHEDSVLRLSLIFEREAVSAVDFNFNRESVTARDAAAAARRWSSDKAETQNVLRLLVGD